MTSKVLTCLTSKSLVFVGPSLVPTNSNDWKQKKSAQFAFFCVSAEILLVAFVLSILVQSPNIMRSIQPLKERWLHASTYTQYGWQKRCSLDVYVVVFPSSFMNQLIPQCKGKWAKIVSHFIFEEEEWASCQFKYIIVLPRRSLWPRLWNNSLAFSLLKVTVILSNHTNCINR